jgi:hypothetical protein
MREVIQTLCYICTGLFRWIEPDKNYKTEQLMVDKVSFWYIAKPETTNIILSTKRLQSWSHALEELMMNQNIQLKNLGRGKGG